MPADLTTGYRRGGWTAHHRQVHVSVLYFAACPGRREAGRRVRLALDQFGHTTTGVTFVPVDVDAEDPGFASSPTITVDGVDLLPHARNATGLSCRVYPTATGIAAVPEVADLVTALQERASR